MVTADRLSGGSLSEDKDMYYLINMEVWTVL